MKLRLLLPSFLFFACINAVLAAPPPYIQTKDGVSVFTATAFTGTSNAVKPEVISDNIKPTDWILTPMTGSYCMTIST